MEPIRGTVVEMDISHMRAGVFIEDWKNGEAVVEAKVGKIYGLGDPVDVFDTSEIELPWYLQGTEFIDKHPISQAEMLGGL